MSGTTFLHPCGCIEQHVDGHSSVNMVLCGAPFCRNAHLYGRTRMKRDPRNITAHVQSASRHVRGAATSN